MTLTPSALQLTVFQSVQFSVRVNGSNNSVVTWSLSGSGCNGATCGTISNAGLYTAPASVPIPATVTVRATPAADTSKSASATITILTETSTWTWVSGSMFRNEPGTYGRKGVAAPLNAPGGRESAVSWIDPSGNFWLFGGWGMNSAGHFWGTLSDLWKYDPTVNEWTWVSGSDIGRDQGIYGTKGVPSSENIPGSRTSAVSWSDPSGELWLFGGRGGDSTGNTGPLNDLWSFDPASNEWTWVSGSNMNHQPGIYGTKGLAAPSNVPGGREWAISWRDSRNCFWLFGGIGLDSVGEYGGGLNDLWKFDPSTLEWTWVSGSDTIDQEGIYGTKGVAAPSNVPGASCPGGSWIDFNDTLWLFGAGGNDLWKFDPLTLEWTWVSGSNSIFDRGGSYGTRGLAAPSNVPGARAGSVSWLGSNGELWLFGGNGFYTFGDRGSLNDLWKFDPTTLEWTWVSGSSIGNEPGIYGTVGVAHFTNVPGARGGAVSWTNSQGELWLFGGEGPDSTGEAGRLNDLWRFIR